MRLLGLLLFFVSSTLSAECFVVGDLAGYSTRTGSDLEISIDALTDQKFSIEIAGDKSSVTPNSMSCEQMGERILVCADQKSGGKLSMETWAVYPDEGKIVYTKANHGYSIFDGANMMVGNIKGNCD